MKIQKFSISQLYKNKYTEVFPYLKQKNTQAFTMIILTLLSLSLFGLFAINPTLSTIANLHKQLEDSQFVYKSLTRKITNLSILKQKYNQLEIAIPLVLAALPKNPNAPALVSQISLIAENTNITIKNLQVFQIELSKTIEGQNKYSAYSFSLNATGTYEDIVEFLSKLTNFDRIVTIDTLSIGKERATDNTVLLLNIKGETYFKK